MLKALALIPNTASNKHGATCLSIIPEFEKWRHKDQEFKVIHRHRKFKASLGNLMRSSQSVKFNMAVKTYHHLTRWRQRTKNLRPTTATQSEASPIHVTSCFKKNPNQYQQQ